MTFTVPTNYDFSGYASKAHVKCLDGRTILPDAFKDQDGARVPLVYQHLHEDIPNVLGHAILENRSDGVYMYGFFNGTPNGLIAKTLVQHGDIESLSIYANGLIEKAKSVIHGVIREVSLVLSGANSEARIDYFALEHGDDGDPSSEEAVIYSGQNIELPKIEHAGESNSEDKTIGDIFDTLTEEQKNAVFAIIGDALGSKDSGSEESEESETAQSGLDLTHSANKGEENVMKENVFDNSVETVKRPRLTRDQMKEIFDDGQKMGSLRQSFLAHAGTYGIDDINVLFPDAVALTKTPTFIARQMEWVPTVIDGAHHSPFSRIKTVTADITVESARALGYVTGALKKDEVFGLLHRETTPTTIYKKQKLDRNDILDITEFDVVIWLKSEMYVMIKEELARAILISDGRDVASADKIPEANIRPIWTDADMYADKTLLADTADVEDLIEAIIRSRENYRGSGSPTMYVAPGTLTDMLLLKATGDGRRMYATEAELAAALRVKRIVEVPLMTDLSREVTVPAPATIDLKAIIVNMQDYTIGADKGGQLEFFDDFDLDYNQMKYLLETRVCGALTLPKSALIIEQTQAEV